MISIRIYITYKAPEERRSFDNMIDKLLLPNS